MGSNRKIILSVVGIVVVSLGIWKAAKIIHHRGSEQSLVEHDREILSRTNATDTELYGALIRLAQKGEVVAQTRALEKRNSLSELVREASAAALGYFDDPVSNKALIEIIRGANGKVKTRAIEALSYRWSKDRQQELDQLLNEKTLDPSSKVAVYSGLIRMSHVQADRDAAIQQLVKIASGEDKVAARVSDDAVSELISLAPQDPSVMSMLRDVVKNGSRSELMPTAILSLGAFQDPWLRSSMSELAKNSHAPVRLAVIQTLHLACPVDRFKILRNSLFTEKDEEVLQGAIRELAVIPGLEALNLANEVAKEKKYIGTDVVLLKKSIEDLKYAKGTDPCANVKESSSERKDK